MHDFDVDFMNNMDKYSLSNVDASGVKVQNGFGGAACLED